MTLSLHWWRPRPLRGAAAQIRAAQYNLILLDAVPVPSREFTSTLGTAFNGQKVVHRGDRLPDDRETRPYALAIETHPLYWPGVIAGAPRQWSDSTIPWSPAAGISVLTKAVALQYTWQSACNTLSDYGLARRPSELTMPGYGVFGGVPLWFTSSDDSAKSALRTPSLTGAYCKCRLCLAGAAMR